MKWRVMLELIGPDGIVGVHEVGGRVAVAGYAPRLIGLTQEEGKHPQPATIVWNIQNPSDINGRDKIGRTQSGRRSIFLDLAATTQRAPPRRVALCAAGRGSR
jgi:hypothetical protein